MSKSVRFGATEAGASLDGASRNIQAFKQRNQEVPQGMRQAGVMQTNRVTPRAPNDGVPPLPGAGTPMLVDTGVAGTKETTRFSSHAATGAGPGWNHLAEMSTEVPGQKRMDTMNWYNDGKWNNAGFPFGAEQAPGKGGLGQVYLDSGFFDFIQKKKEVEMWNDYETFKMSLVDTSDEALRSWWKEHHPDLWDRKKKAYEDMLEVKKKYDLMMFTGANSEEDLRYLYLMSINSKVGGLGAGRPLQFQTLQPKTFPPQDLLRFDIERQGVTPGNPDGTKYHYARQPY